MSKGQGRGIAAVFAALVAISCAGPSGRDAAARGRPSAEGSGPRTTMTIAISNAVSAMGIMGFSSTSGGWPSLNELHSSGLVTSDVHSRQPVGRLATEAPSVDDGTLAVLPDGRMRAIFHLRDGVRWHDGAPFTSADMVFSYQFNSDAGLPTVQRPPIKQMASVEAPDDHTFVIYFKGPYYAASTLGLRALWPVPRHILQAAYERYLASGNAEEVAGLPYWTSDYLHLGPYRLTSFNPTEGMVFNAFDGYFLGRPKIDEVHVRVFLDSNALLAALLAGSVDMVLDGTLGDTAGFELRDRWRASGDGTVYVTLGAQRFVSPQFRPDVQAEPANLDPKVRAALYHALDREALAEGLVGQRDLAAWELLPPGDRLYDATKGAFRKYAFEPDRAAALLREAGWTSGQDGVLHHAPDGRAFRTALWGTASGGTDREASAVADYWRRAGIEVDEFAVPSVQARNPEFRANYPGWELTSAGGGGDGILVRLEWPAPSAENRWVGSNRGGYDDPRARQLIGAYYTSPSFEDQFRAMQALSSFLADELPLLILYTTPEQIAVRKGVKALDDLDGGAGPANLYGSYSRNAHLWEIR